LNPANLWAQIAREYGIHPNLPCRWRDELAEDPERAFSGNGYRCKYEAMIADLERLLGQAHAENELLKNLYDSAIHAQNMRNANCLMQP
jgi:transposase